MTIPIYKDKYTQKGLINPAALGRYSGYPDTIPQNILIAFDPLCLEHFQETYTITKTIVLHPDLIVYQHEDMGFVRLAGIGGPNLVAAVEEMIPLGAKSFITVGTSGGLRKGGVYVIHKALRDEGTSYHYLPSERYIQSNPRLMTKLYLSLNYLEIPCDFGTTWTIDAPYRETPEEVRAYSREKIDVVEMECASLFAVAKFRNVAAASVVVVGDILSETWTPQYHDSAVQKMLCCLVDTGVDCLTAGLLGIPPGLVKCEHCGEYKGTTKDKYLNWKGMAGRKEYENSDKPVEFTCLCESVVCPRCGKGRIRHPVTNHYIEATNSLAHTPYFITWGGCSECRDKCEDKNKVKKKDNPTQVTITDYPGLRFASIGPIQGMRPNCCVAPQWVIQYGLPRLKQMLSEYNIPSHHYQLYESYFKELWEGRKATEPSTMCHPYILMKVEEFTEKLRDTKRGIFGQ